MTEFTFAPGEKNIIGDRFSPSVIIFWLKTSIAASSTRIQYTTPNTLFGLTQHDAAVLANLTVDMVKKYESEKYRIQPSGRMREMLEHYLAEHRRAVAAIVERHRGDEQAVLSFSRVSDLPEGLPDWVRAEESVKRRAAAVREAAVLLEVEGVAVDYTYLPEETE